MDTINKTSLDRENLAWMVEREQDLASWLDEVGPELQEQVLCGGPFADVGDEL